MKEKYTMEERTAALGTSLSYIAAYLGFTVVRKGVHQSLKEMDSLIIYHDRTYNRFSGKTLHGHPSGTTIDFMLEFGGCEIVPEAIHKIIHMTTGRDNPERIQQRTGHTVPGGIASRDGLDEEAVVKSQGLVLPEKNENYKRACAYLGQTRGISNKTIQYCLQKQLFYEEREHHNLVFLGRDPGGEIQYAAMRGTYTYGKKYRGDVSGSNKAYGVSLVNEHSNILVVFEAVIDMMSYLDVSLDYETNKLALGCISDKALQQFLEDYPHITQITFCLDADKAGKEAVFGTEAEVDYTNEKTIRERKIGYLERYQKAGYKVEVKFPPKNHCKDWNEYLLYQKSVFQNTKKMI